MRREENLTDELIKQSIENDTIGRNYYLENFLGTLLSISRHTILALDGDWGSGKTYFVRQLQYVNGLGRNFSYGSNAHSINSETVDKFADKYSVFYFNAWQYDDLPAKESILLALSSFYYCKNAEISNKLLAAAWDIASNMSKVLTQGIIDLNSIKQTVNKDPVNKVENLDGVNRRIWEILGDAKKKTGKAMLLIIDDLDRCKPTYAVELLETIKHYFANDNIVFLICANNSELQHTIKKYYGKGFDGYRYLDRFYDVIFKLPDIETEKYIDQYFSFGGNKNAIHVQAVKTLVKKANLPLRQINRYCSEVELISEQLTHSGRHPFINQKLRICFCQLLIPFALFLKHISIEDFDNFMQGKGGNLIHEWLQNEFDYYAKEITRDNLETINNVYKESFTPHEYTGLTPFDEFKAIISMMSNSLIIDSPEDDIIEDSVDITISEKTPND